MPQRPILALATTALLLAVAQGHGDEHGSMEMHDAPKPQPQAQHADHSGSYWGLSGHVGLMYTHIALEVIAWFVVLPTGQWSQILNFTFTINRDLTFPRCNV